MAGKSQKSTGKAKVKVGKLQVNKETVKDLTKDEAKKVKGGIVVIPKPRCTLNVTGC